MQITNNNRFATAAGIAIGPILFVVAILAVLVGAIAAGSGGFGSSTADEAARVRASTIIQQAVTIKGAFDRIIVNGSTPAQVIVSESPATPNSLVALYGTAGGGITVQNPPRDAVVAGATWRFVIDAGLSNIGAAGNNDVITLLQVSLPTCNALNDLIFGRGQYAAPPAITAPDVVAAVVAAGDNPIPTSNNFTGTMPAAASGRTSACLAEGANYWYYQLLAAG